MPKIVRAAIEHGGAAQDQWLEMPADLAYKLRYYHGVYSAFRGYRNAGAQNATVPWTQANPDAWDLVTRVINMRRERKAK